MTKSLSDSVASTLDADPRLLPLLPELLADLSELGSSADQIVSLLRFADLEPGSTVLDLGCGKGAIAVALAERLRLRVEGVDGMPEFVSAARALAAARGVAERCAFGQGDVRELLGSAARHDAVLLLALGPIAHSLERTVAGLRTLVRPGGWMVIDDGYVAGDAPLRGYERNAGRAETLRQLGAAGDQVVAELVATREETRAVNERNSASIRKRAESLKTAHPALATLIDAYVAGQVRETEVLGTGFICATWLLRRSAGV